MIDTTFDATRGTTTGAPRNQSMAVTVTVTLTVGPIPTPTMIPAATVIVVSAKQTGTALSGLVTDLVIDMVIGLVTDLVTEMVIEIGIGESHRHCSLGTMTDGATTPGTVGIVIIIDDRYDNLSSLINIT